MILDMVPWLGLADTINWSSALFRRCSPHSETDRVLTVAYNLFAGGMCRDHLNLQRMREADLMHFREPASSPTQHGR